MENKTQLLNVTHDVEQPITTNLFSKQLGKVVYEVSVNFKQGATETLDKKILRIIKNELGRYSD